MASYRETGNKRHTNTHIYIYVWTLRVRLGLSRKTHPLTKLNSPTGRFLLFCFGSKNFLNKVHTNNISYLLVITKEEKIHILLHISELTKSIKYTYTNLFSCKSYLLVAIIYRYDLSSVCNESMSMSSYNDMTRIRRWTFICESPLIDYQSIYNEPMKDNLILHAEEEEQKELCLLFLTSHCFLFLVKLLRWSHIYFSIKEGTQLVGFLSDLWYLLHVPYLKVQ